MMKKVLYICLILLVLGGIGAGYWLLRSSNETVTDTQIAESDITKYQNQLISFAYKDLESTKHLADYEAQFASLAKLETATNAVLFAPTKTAVEQFVKDTALDVVKFLPYHIVISDLPIDVVEGSKLKTDDGQEVIIVKIDSNLYVRDAKGNDVRLRKPIETQNGKIYVIDRVLLTQ